MANGDTAAEAGMPVVSPLAQVKMGYDEINLTRDLLVDYVQQNVGFIQGGVWLGNTTDAGIVHIPVPGWWAGAGISPTSLVCSSGDTTIDEVTRIIQPITWDRGPYVGATTIQVRVRREDTNQWIGASPVVIHYVITGARTAVASELPAPL